MGVQMRGGVVCQGNAGCVYDDVTYTYDDVTYAYDDVTYAYDDVSCLPRKCRVCVCMMM